MTVYRVVCDGNKTIEVNSRVELLGVPLGEIKRVNQQYYALDYSDVHIGLSLTDNDDPIIQTLALCTVSLKTFNVRYLIVAISRIDKLNP